MPTKILVTIFKKANPAHVIIPILVWIIVFPILVIAIICCIRVKNMKHRRLRLERLGKRNNISKAASRAFNPAVRFVLPDLELGTVFEEDNNADNETFGQETDEDKEDIKLLQKKRRRINICQCKFRCNGKITSSYSNPQKFKRWRINQDLLREEMFSNIGLIQRTYNGTAASQWTDLEKTDRYNYWTHRHKVSFQEYSRPGIHSEELATSSSVKKEENSFNGEKCFYGSKHQTPIFFINDQIWKCEIEMKI